MRPLVTWLIRHIGMRAGSPSKFAVGTCWDPNLDIDAFNFFFDPDREPELTTPTRFAELVERFERNEFDMVAIGRSILADPQFIQKMRRGRYDEIILFTKAAIPNFHWVAGTIGEVNGFSEVTAEGVVPSKAV